MRVNKIKEYKPEFIEKFKEIEKQKKEEILKYSETDIKINTKYKIEFEDYGQDFLHFLIDNDGWVIDCQPLQAWVWIGRWTIPQGVKVGDKLPIWNNGESYINYPIKSIEVLR